MDDWNHPVLGSYNRIMLTNRDELNGATEFHVWVDVTVDPPCVGVSGEVDLASCAAFRDALTEAIEAQRQAIVLDFSRVTFMGSTGIRELVRALQLVDRIEVQSPKPIVRRALEAASISGGLVITDA